MTRRLMCIGECMVEMAPVGNGTLSMGFAGDTFNTAWYLRRLAGPDLDVAFLTAVGDDDPSHAMIDFMRQSGVMPEFKYRPGGSVGLYLISLNNGERSFSYWRDTSAARTLADDLDILPGMNAGDIAFFSGITLAILPDAGRRRFLSVMSDARATGVQIVFDPNLRPRLWQSVDVMRDCISAAAKVADIVLPSFEDEGEYFGDNNRAATAERYQSAGAGMVIVKDGAGPVLIADRNSQTEVTPGSVPRVVDTTAAGDAFNAGFLAQFIAGATPADAVRAGCRVSARVIAGRGALVDIPDLTTLLNQESGS